LFVTNLFTQTPAGLMCTDLLYLNFEVTLFSVFDLMHRSCCHASSLLHFIVVDPLPLLICLCIINTVPLALPKSIRHIHVTGRIVMCLLRTGDSLSLKCDEFQ